VRIRQHTIMLMNTLNMTAAFSLWLESLTDRQLKARVITRIANARLGNFGDCKSVGQGVFEMRIHAGKGWRIYYAQEGKNVYLLLDAGSKATQQRDIETAIELWMLIKKRNDDETKPKHN